jgi:hypothetical protein
MYFSGGVWEYGVLEVFSVEINSSELYRTGEESSVWQYESWVSTLSAASGLPQPHSISCILSNLLWV